MNINEREQIMRTWFDGLCGVDIRVWLVVNGRMMAYIEGRLYGGPKLSSDS